MDANPLLPTHASPVNDELVRRIGALTRQLHEALRDLGGDRILERAAREMPDARDRLDYVARLTQQAAERVLGAVESAQASTVRVRASISLLRSDIDRGLEVGPALAQFERAAGDQLDQVDGHLHEIMMAQDFQDLTGQVIQKLVRLVGDLESQLLRFLLDAVPVERDADRIELEGPAIGERGAGDVVTDQGQVDDLLESLGF